MNQKHTIDAKGLALGRLASQVAILLMGKNDASFEKHILSNNEVTVTNASQLKMSIKKMKTVEHERYSGYPGGFKTQKVEEIIAKKGYAELVRLSVYGMLPNNKHRSRMMTKLTVTE